MRYLVVLSVAIALLASSSLATRDWQTNFYQGIECTGEALGIHHGDVTPKKGATCHHIPAIGVTSAFDFYDKLHGGDQMYLSLHKDLDCKDSGGGHYEGQPSIPICIPVNNYVAFKIHTISKGKRDEQIADADRELPVTGSELQVPELQDRYALEEVDNGDDIVDSDDMSLIEARRTQCFQPSFLLAALLGAGTFLHMAIGSCPPTASEGNINAGQCALDSTLTVALSLLSGFSAQGIYKHGETKRAELPVEDTSLIDGYSTTIMPAGDLPEPYYLSTADGWEHFHFHAQDLDDLSVNHTSVLSIHEESGRNRITAPVGGTQQTLDRRSNKPHYTAYYSWVNGQKKLFKKQEICKDKPAAKKIAIRLWNYGRHKNKDEFCADLFGRSTKLSNGEFAIIDGTFTDFAGRC